MNLITVTLVWLNQNARLQISCDSYFFRVLITHTLQVVHIALIFSVHVSMTYFFNYVAFIIKKT